MNRILATFALAAAFPAAADAQVIITEIMYDLDGSDSGREWIEVQNIGTAPIDLTSWRFFESNSNHKLAGTRSLSPGAYAIIADDIAKFRADWPSFSGTVYESAFSLNNDGETIEMRQGERTIDAVAYDSTMGGDGSGDSLQRIESSFMPGSPTPGAPIPERGLITAVPEEEGQVVETLEVVGERQQAQIASIAVATGGAWQWWLAPAALAAFASGGFLLYSRRKSEEWEIEEME